MFEGYAGTYVLLCTILFFACMVCLAVVGKDHWSAVALALILVLLLTQYDKFILVRLSAKAWLKVSVAK